MWRKLNITTDLRCSGTQCKIQNRPSHIWQFELTKRLFHHVAIYWHAPVLALSALKLNQGKGTQKTIFYSFIFPGIDVSKLELSKSKRFCSIGNCLNLYWKSWDENNTILNLEMFTFYFFFFSGFVHLHSFKHQFVFSKLLCWLEGLGPSAQIPQDRSPAMWLPYYATWLRSKSVYCQRKKSLLTSNE